MKTKSCVVIRHLQFEDLGSFAEPLTAAGYQLQYLDVAIDDLTAAYQADLTVILGGPVGVYDTALYPFLQTELLIAKQRLAQRKPLLGVCLGAQLIAAAAGAAAYPGVSGKEIGWLPIQFTQEALDTGLFAVDKTDAEIQMFHWHGDTFDLPAGAELLASSESYKQIYRIGTQVLAFQCHPELEGQRIEQWLLGHAAELAAWPLAELAKIRQDTQAYAPALRQFSQQLLTRWLSQL
jgi:GMP synthase (glutamine-hydrolysing)